MAKEPLSEPVQETGSNNTTVKYLPQDGYGVSSTEKSMDIESLEILGEAPPVEENYGLPKVQAASFGFEDGQPPTNKVSTGTQTETEYFEQSAEVKPEPEVEKESDIKEMSTQTLLEADDQLSPGSDVKGKKKKKQRPRKRRLSKEKKEAQPSNEATQSPRPISFPFQLKSGKISKKVSSLVLFLIFCSIGVTQCYPVDNVKEECYVYSFVAQSSITSLDIKKGTKILCEVSVNTPQKEVPCAGYSVLLIDRTLFLITKEKSDSYFVEIGEMETLKFEYEDVFSNVESARRYINAKGAQTTPSVPTENPPALHTAEEMPGWQIGLILSGILGLAAIVAALCWFKYKPCRRNGRNGSPPANSTELEALGNSQVRNGPERPATA